MKFSYKYSLECWVTEHSSCSPMRIADRAIPFFQTINNLWGNKSRD